MIFCNFFQKLHRLSWPLLCVGKVSIHSRMCKLDTLHGIHRTNLIHDKVNNLFCVMKQITDMNNDLAIEVVLPVKLFSILENRPGIEAVTTHLSLLEHLQMSGLCVGAANFKNKVEA